MKNTLQGVPVRQFMRADPVAVSPDLTVEQLVDDYIYRHHYRMFPVVEESGELIGCVSTSGVRTLPREKWPWRTVRDIMTVCGSQNAISPDMDALDALTLMSKTANSRLMVVENGHLVGILTLRDLMSFLSTRLELDGRTKAAKDAVDQQIGSHHHPAPHHS